MDKIHCVFVRGNVATEGIIYEYASRHEQLAHSKALANYREATSFPTIETQHIQQLLDPKPPTIGAVEYSPTPKPKAPRADRKLKPLGRRRARCLF